VDRTSDEKPSVCENGAYSGNVKSPMPNHIVSVYLFIAFFVKLGNVSSIKECLAV
jgi:hypothetical protein